MPSILQSLKNNIPLSNMAATDRQVLFFCMGLAFLFWLILNLSQEYEINKEVEIEYVVNPNRVLAGNPPRNIPVQIRGKGWNLIWESLRGNVIPVEVQVGEESRFLLSSNLLTQEIRRKLSSGDLDIEEMMYESESVLTTPLAGKMVRIVPNATLRFRSGYYTDGPIIFTPDSVTISGSTDELADIDSWPTAAEVLENIETDVSRTINLQDPPEGLTINYQQALMEFEVEPFIERQFTVPISLRNVPPADSFRVFPSEVIVTITVGKSAYGKYDANDFRIEADLEQLERNEEHNTVPLTLTDHPSGIKSVQFEPRAAEYYVYRDN